MAMALALASCSSSPASPTPSRAPSHDPRLGSLEQHLPPGFSVSTNAALPSGPADLAVAPAPDFAVSQVHVTALPAQATLALISATVINEPSPVLFHPLFVSTTTLTPGARIIVAAAQLALSPAHAVLFILQGPGYRAEHLVATARGVAVGIVTLPASMSRGTWYVAVQDLSQHHLTNTPDAGRVLADVAVFQVQ